MALKIRSILITYNICMHKSSTGHSLSRRLETDSGFQRQGGDQGFGTEDQLLMHREVDQRLNALQQKQNQLRMYLAERDRELGVHMQLGDMESGIKKVQRSSSTEGIYMIQMILFFVQNIIQ